MLKYGFNFILQIEGGGGKIVKPSLSILIPNYNGEQTITRTLDSILNQKQTIHTR